MYLKCSYRRNQNNQEITPEQPADLDVDFYPGFLNPELANAWYLYLEELLPHLKGRSTVIFGNEGLIYRVNYQGENIERPVYSWTEMPALFELKTLIEKVTNQTYTVCVMQRYNNGNSGILPHRDKEMVAGTRICGLSLGATRTISFSKGYGPVIQPLKLSLSPGSLYVMNPPTNQKWLHSIEKEPKVTQSRISLTFRDYRG